MKNKTKIFYHIHRKRGDDSKWQVGNTIKIDQNDFVNISLNFNPLVDVPDKKEVPIINAIDYYQQEGIKAINIQMYLLDKAKMYLNEYQILIRELALEEVRKKYFNKLPSRKECIWLCREDQIEYWIKNLNAKEYIVYKIEVYNKPFRSRNLLIPKPSDSYLEMCQKAEEYWEYNGKEDNNDDEYLYNGYFKILEIMDLKKITNINKELSNINDKK